MEYRRATQDDVRLLARMNRQLIVDEGHRNTMALTQLEERMSGWLAGEYEACIFANAGEDVGYCLFKREPEWIYLRQMLVLPDHRRKNIGREALEWLIANEWSNAPRIRIDVLVWNADALGFWNSVGFEDYCITMEREIS